MKWLPRKKQPTPDTEAQPAATVEIEAHKDATKEAIVQAKAATKQLNNLLVENGFTLKLYLATGGTHTKRKK